MLTNYNDHQFHRVWFYTVFFPSVLVNWNWVTYISARMDYFLTQRFSLPVTTNRCTILLFYRCVDLVKCPHNIFFAESSYFNVTLRKDTTETAITPRYQNKSKAWKTYMGSWNPAKRKNLSGELYKRNNFFFRSRSAHRPRSSLSEVRQLPWQRWRHRHNTVLLPVGEGRSLQTAQTQSFHWSQFSNLLCWEWQNCLRVHL